VGARLIVPVQARNKIPCVGREAVRSCADSLQITLCMEIRGLPSPFTVKAPFFVQATPIFTVVINIVLLLGGLSASSTSKSRPSNT